jgi:hypothetical protein
VNTLRVWQSSWAYVGGLDAAELEVVEYHMSGYLLSVCAGEQAFKDNMDAARYYRGHRLQP